MYTFFFSPSPQYIMSPDYVTTGIVSDHIGIKDEDLIQRGAAAGLFRESDDV